MIKIREHCYLASFRGVSEAIMGKKVKPYPLLACHLGALFPLNIDIVLQHKVLLQIPLRLELLLAAVCIDNNTVITTQCIRIKQQQR